MIAISSRIDILLKNVFAVVAEHLAIPDGSGVSWCGALDSEGAT